MNEIYNNTDTICAISTPPGVGGIAVIRVSGPEAIPVVEKIWSGADLTTMKSHTVHLGKIVEQGSGAVLDQAVLTLFRTPNSYTAQDVIEMSIHGSRWIQSSVLQALADAGARLALPGEFTRRAYLNGRLDLAEAEAVGDLIASTSRAAHRIAMSQLKGDFSNRITQLREALVELASLMELELDFAEEEVEFASRDKLRAISEKIISEIDKLVRSFKSGNAIKNGIPVAILGATNAGKSSLLNKLLEEDRAIVSHIHGTTRDVIEDTLTIGDYLVRLIDTAGLRPTNDHIEQLGIERSRRMETIASHILYLVDVTEPKIPSPQNSDSRYIFIINKRDLLSTAELENSLKEQFPGNKILSISTNAPEDIEKVRKILSARISASAAEEGDVTITNIRHAQALSQAAESLRNLLHNMETGLSTELLAEDLRESISSLSTITGQITTPEILNKIFQSFCVGK